jgi:hypothetical protein
MAVESKTYWIHKMMAVILDILIVIIFVLIGKREHGETAGFAHTIKVALPFVASFFALQLIVMKDQRSIRGAFICAIIAVPVAIALRVSQPEYDFKPAFLIVAWIFLTFGWVAWRFILGKLRPSNS